MQKLRPAHAAIAVIILGIFPFPSATPQHAHIHGEAQAAIIIEGDRVSISFISSMHNIVGFEHFPQSDDQEATLAEAISALESGTDLFTFNANANCRFVTSDIHVPIASEELEDEHSRDLDASFTFECARPNRLRTLSFNLMARFESLERVEVIVITGNRQLAYQLTSQDDTLRLDPR